ncbi:type II toxin-antitoxin system RelB family antitoxin [Oribacterium sp.]
MTISLRLNEADSMLFKKYAEMNGISVSELLRRSVLEHIEEEYDLQAYQEAIEEYKENPITYTLDEVEKELGLG